MSFFNKKKNGQTPQKPLSELERDIQELLKRPDVNSKEDICKIEYDKALGMLKVQNPYAFQHTYDIMQGLCSMFNYVPAIMWMGRLNENNGNVSSAAEWYKKAADFGDGEGCRCYADMLMTGTGIPQDQTLAIEYYQKASDAGVPEASFVIGEYYRIAGNIQQSKTAYEKAAKSGYEPAQERLNQLRTHTVNDEKVESKIEQTGSSVPVKVEQSDTSFETEKKLYYDLEKSVATEMHKSQIISSAQLNFLNDDAGIAKYVVHSDLESPQLSSLRNSFSDTFLLIVGMHAMGAGMYTAMIQKNNNKPISEFSENELTRIKRDMSNIDPYELALSCMGISTESNNKKVLDHIISSCVIKLKELAGSDAFKTDQVKIMAQILFDAGITLILSQ